MKTKQILLSLAGLIIITSIGFNVFGYFKIKKLTKNALTTAVSKEDSANAPAKTVQKNKENSPKPADKKPVVKDISKLEEELESTEDALDETSEQLSLELAKREAYKKAQVQYQKDIASNPAFKNSMKKALLQAIDSDYENLYDRLDLTPEQKEGFKKIVGDWRIDNMSTADVARTAATDEEKAEAYRLRDMKREKYKEQFVELMGEEKYNTYNDFRMSRFDRSTLDGFIQTVPPENRIDDSVMVKLIDRMHEERSVLEKKMGFYDTYHFASDMNDEYVDRQTELATQVYAKYVELGAEFLPPEQVEQYRAYIEKTSESYIRDVKMRAYILGNN